MRGIQDVHGGELLFSQLNHLFVRALPERVAFVAEILEPNPDMRWIGNQSGAPVVKDLQTPNKNVRLLDVDPVVLYELAVGFEQLDFVTEHANSDEVAVHQTIRDFSNLGGCRRLEISNQFLHRHG